VGRTTVAADWPRKKGTSDAHGSLAAIGRTDRTGDPRARPGWEMLILVGFLACAGQSLANAADDQAAGALHVTRISASGFQKKAEIFSAGAVPAIEVWTAGSTAGIRSAAFRVTSRLAGYDSGWRSLSATSDGTHLIGHWDTWGLEPARDYSIAVRVEDASGQPVSETGPTLVLDPAPSLPTVSSVSLDSHAPGRRLAATFVRTHNLNRHTFTGPLGYGWTHSLAARLQVFEDGTLKVFEAFGDTSWYFRDASGSYVGRPGDRSTVQRRSDGCFERKKLSELIELFGPDGRLENIAEPNGNRLQFLYDSASRLSGVQTSNGSGVRLHYGADDRIDWVEGTGQRRTEYEYDKTGNLISASVMGSASTRYQYDTEHRLRQMAQPNGRIVQFTYDQSGRLMLRSDNGGSGSRGYEYDTAARQIVVTDATGGRTQVTLNVFNDITSTTDALGNRTAFTFDPTRALTEVLDAVNRRRVLRYDEYGNLTAVVDPADRKTAVAYAPGSSRVTAVTDPLGRVTTFDYDARGNLLEVRYPDRTTERHSWNVDGTESTRTDRSGRVTAYTYHASGRLATALFGDGEKTTYEYDEAGNVTRVVDGSREYRYEYDPAGRMLAGHAPGGNSLRYVYDAAGQKIARLGPGSIELRYAYSAGRLVSIGEANGRRIANYEYDRAGRISMLTTGNGVRTSYVYDETGRLSDLRCVGPAGELLTFFAYAYDAVGNRTSARTPIGTRTFAYDATGSLVSAVYEDGREERFAYDPAGARAKAWTNGQESPYRVNEAGQVVAAGTTQFEFDGNGNRTKDGRGTYRFDTQDRLVRAVVDGQEYGYGYDYRGRRQRKTGSGLDMSFLWDDQQLAADLSNDGAVQATYVYGDRTDEILSMRKGEARLFYVLDGLGSVVALTDEAGRLVERYGYDAYGVTATRSSVGNRFGYTAREFDSETGLYNYRARYYDPQHGTFVSRDPAGWNWNAHPYEYVLNNPVNFTDPHGLEATRSFVRVNWNWGSVIRDLTTEMTRDVLIHLTAEEFGRLGDLAIESSDFGGGLPVGRWFREQMGSRSGSGFVGLFAGDPSFVQPPSTAPRASRPPLASEALVARIDLPGARSLVRGMVPVFGVAYGKAFKEYRLEYGSGQAPQEWVLIARSAESQVKSATPAEVYFSPDVTVKGNLGTWDTGLRSYVYLPEYPPDHPVDLNGVYTLRLVATGLDGQEVEDRIEVQVGEAIPNAFGGTVKSPDGLVELTISEHGLKQAFRLLAIRRLADGESGPPAAPGIVGGTYEVREPDERFVSIAVLTFKAVDQASGETRVRTICAFDSTRNAWQVLRATVSDGGTLSAEIDRVLPYYAVCLAPPRAEPRTGTGLDGPRLPANTSNGHLLVNDTFEDGMSEWSSPSGQSGVDLALNTAVGGDGSGCLEIKTTDATGGPLVTVRSTPYDSRDYPVVRFDYRIPSGLKVDLLAKVDGRWYLVRLTGNSKEMSHQRVNMRAIGSVDGLVVDDGWHTLELDLDDMLRRVTGHSRIERLELADFSVTGYMKLQPGVRVPGLSMYIDNFQIAGRFSPSVRIDAPKLVIDAFNKAKLTGALGQRFWIFSDSPSSLLGQEQPTFVRRESGPAGLALELPYDLSGPGSWIGYSIGLPGLDASPYRNLTLSISGVSPTERVVLELRDSAGNEGRVTLPDYPTRNSGNGWHKVQMPLAAFSGMLQWSSLARISIAVEHQEGSSRGVLRIDDVALESELRSVLIHDFEGDSGTNRLGGTSRVRVEGAAALNSAAGESEEGVLRLSFGGSIGGLSNYAAWETDLKGIDVSRCDAVSFRIRGLEGSEPATLYLDDGSFRWGVPVEQASRITRSWQDMSVPLPAFARYGVDLTHIESLGFVFEWKPMSGTVFIDDLWLVCGRTEK